MSTLVEIDHKALTAADIAAINAFENLTKREIRPDDPPTPIERTEAQVRNFPASLILREFWLRDEDGALVAVGFAWWRDANDNKHMAWCDVTVRSDKRRRGIGTRMLRHVFDAVRADGRTLMCGMTTERVPSGEAFARRIGAEVGQRVHMNRLMIADVDESLVRTWIEEGPVRAPGYSLVTIDGPFPDDIVEHAVRAFDVMNTAPHDDLAVEDSEMTVEQMRDIEKSGLAEGTERWVLFARHDATGELVGLSEVFWNPALPRVVNQGDTGVHPDHRGHALGKWMKAVMLERIMRERPGVDQIRTGNADSNDAMLGINHALGFKPFIASINWQANVETIERYLDQSV